MNYEEAIAKIEEEYGTFLHYNIIVRKVVKYYTESKPIEHENMITKTINENIKSLNYQEIIDDVKEKTIAKIKEVQTEILNFQEIEAKMQQEAVTKIEAKILDEITEQNNKLKEKVCKQEYELPEVQAKLNESNTKKAELLRKIADSFEQERKLFKKGRKLPQQIRQSRTRISEEGDLSQKLADYNKILEFMNGEKGLELEKRLLRMAKGKTKEDIILQAKETILDAIAFYQKYTHKRRSSMVFHIIHSHIIPQPGGEQFIADNFSKVIQFGFKDQEPQGGLLNLIQKIVDKLKIDGKLSLYDKEEESYQYILSQYKEVHDQLEKLKAVCSSEGLYKKFYVFIDFIYNFEKEKEEENLKKELQRKKAEEELLAEKETGCKPKQPQLKKKKKNKSRNKNSKIVISNIINEPEAQDSKKEEEIPENAEVRALREELQELIKLLFPDQKSKEFEEKAKKAISELKNQQIFQNQKINNLYCIIIDFYLNRIAWNIKYYNIQYGEIIEQTKDNFGTKKFNWNPNEFITSHLTNIALMVQGIDTDLKEAHLMLDKVTPLVYEDYQNQPQNDYQKGLEMMGEKNQELLSEFLNHLKAFGKWHDNKLCVVRERRIYSRRKNDQERADEKKALNTIKSCVDSLGTFVNEFGYIKNSNISDRNKEPPMEYYGSHQQWCVLSKINVEKFQLPSEIERCSC